jgi:hypothetical protein
MPVDLRSSHYRFGINELAESTHGWHAAEDANPAPGVIALDTTFLLRFTVQETGGTLASNTDQQFQCRLNGGTYQDITTTSTIVKAVTTSVFANGADLTKRLGGTGTFEASGDGGTHDGLSGGPQNDIAASGNSETECALQIVGADVPNGGIIDFRLTSPDFTITNDVVPSLAVPVTRTPPVGSLGVVGIAAVTVIDTILAPLVGALVAAGVAGSLLIGTLLTPLSGVLVQAGVAPSVSEGIFVTPPGVGLVVTGVAPTLEIGGHASLTPPAGELAFSGVAPSLGIEVAPPSATLTLTGSPSSLVEGTVVNPPVGTVTLLGDSPILGVGLLPSPGTLSLIGQAPVLRIEVRIQPDPGTLLVLGQTSELLLDLRLTPVPGELNLVGVPPQIGGATPSLEPPTGSLTLLGQASILDLGLTPSTGSLTFVPTTPTLRLGTLVSPASVGLLLEGIAPSLLENRILVPGTGSLGIIGDGPGIILGTILTPAPVSVNLAGLVPDLSLDFRLTPLTASISLIGTPPAFPVRFHGAAIEIVGIPWGPVVGLQWPDLRVKEA